MDKYTYYVLHEIVKALNRGNLMKALREFEELKAYKVYKKDENIREIIEKVEETIKYYTRQLMNRHIVIIKDYCINGRLCLGGYGVVLAEVVEHYGSFVIVKYEHHGAETLSEAYRIAEKLARQYNAKIVYDFER